MNKLIVLFEAICSVYDRGDLVPLPDGTTFCNTAVQVVLNAFDYHGVDAMSADQMVELFSSDNNWRRVSTMEDAQDLANAGCVVIAGLNSRNLGQAHGHVCIVRPGTMCDSGKWGKTARCLNIGGQNFLARGKKGPLTGMAVGLNEAFVPMPFMWLFVPSITA